ncbi:MAG: MarR family winged helix-turn-helix transcriptional regulator [Clostridium sp.]
MENKYLGREISELYRMGNAYLAKRFSEYSIGAGQYLFLAKIYRNEGVSQEELSELLNIDKATTTRAVTKLEEQGYIKRVKSNEDKRRNKIFLTVKAKSFQNTFFEILNEWNNKLTDSLDNEEKEELFYLLEKISKNISNSR